MIRTYSCLHFFFLATALVFVAHTGFCVFECKAISSVWVFEHRMEDGSREGKEGREDGEGGGVLLGGVTRTRCAVSQTPFNTAQPHTDTP